MEQKQKLVLFKGKWCDWSPSVYWELWCVLLALWIVFPTEGINSHWAFYIFLKLCFWSRSHVFKNMARTSKCLHSKPDSDSGGEIQLSPSVCRGLAPGPLPIPISVDAQIPYKKWHSICKQPSRILPYTVILQQMWSHIHRFNQSQMV